MQQSDSKLHMVIFDAHNDGVLLIPVHIERYRHWEKTIKNAYKPIFDIFITLNDKLAAASHSMMKKIVNTLLEDVFAVVN